jgi:tetratricopeptide (TPR) repeat protein
VLDLIRQLEAQGSWSEIRQLAPSLLLSVPDSDRARLHESLSRAFQQTARGAADWQMALSHAHACCESATAPAQRLWALHQIACVAVDMGKLSEAAAFAKTFLTAVQEYPAAQRFTPWVLRALSHVYYQRRKFALAVSLRQSALAMFEEIGNVDEIARTKLNLVWAYVRAGRPRQAREIVMSLNAPESMLHLVHGADAAVLLAEGKYQQAYRAGRLALDGNRLAHDFADAADVCLVVAQATQKLGNHTEALACIHIAAKLFALQARGLTVLSILYSGPLGGDLLYVHAAASLGSGGYHPVYGRFHSGIA